MSRLTFGFSPPFSRRRKRPEPPPACHHKAPISILHQSVGDLWWTKFPAIVFSL